MTRDEFVQEILYGTDHSVSAVLLRGSLTPMAALHVLGLECYLMPFQLGIRKRYRLSTPVIAIGNLSSGGTGKTPMTILVARQLHKSGKKVVVLSRGHGGTGESGSVPRIVSTETEVLMTPTQAGDEPVLLANRLPGVPVIVGRDRRKSGKLAQERFAPDVIVCDDALQYWQLHRDLDIVLLDARRPFDNGYVLPRGLLREPPAHLARAGVIVLTRADRVQASVLEQTVQQVRKYAPLATIYTASHEPTAWISPTGERLPLTELQDRAVLAFSGIADGQAFRDSVRTLNVQVTRSEDFGDHHQYTTTDIEQLTEAAQGAQAVVTTEKDRVKVAPLWPENAPALYALRIGMKVNEEAEFVGRITEVVASATSV